MFASDETATQGNPKVPLLRHFTYLTFLHFVCVGFAHLDCSDHEAAAEIVSKMNGFMLSERPLKSDFAERSDRIRSPRETPYSREPREGGARRVAPPTPSVFIANLAWDVTPELVEDMVTDVVGPNTFVRVRMAVDRETGKPRGFAHIDLVSSAAAERAVRELNGMDVLGRQIRADFATSNDRVRRAGSRGGSRNRDDEWA